MVHLAADPTFLDTLLTVLDHHPTSFLAVLFLGTLAVIWKVASIKARR